MHISSDEIPSGSPFKFEVDGIKYELFTTDDASWDGYATVIVWDSFTDERHYCPGILEVNNHRFLFRYGAEYNYNRDNWVYNTKIEIDII